MTVLPWIGPPQMAEQNLARRLDALAGLVAIGRQHEETKTAAGFSTSLLDDSEAVLRRAGERLRLSGNHTVVALAGGTGSGKSTLFNALAGATFSQPGVTRPTTRHVHACVWGMQGAAPLLDWLGVQRRHRFARASALDSGESALDGLLLLDLPDHDSVVTASMAAVDRLSKLADMLVWVLDPQKYADASVHNRYLIPLAGHAGVFTVVLNQIDLLPEDQVKDCENDLRRLLDAEGLADTPVLPVSARTGAGLDELRELLTEAVSANRAASDRISADIDSVAGGFEVYAGPQVAPGAALASLAAATGFELSAPVPEDDGPARPPWELSEDEQAQAEEGRPPWDDATPDGSPRHAVDPVVAVPEAPAADLTEAFAAAAGLTAVAESVAGARQAVAARFTGWPPALLARRGGDPVRALRGRTAELAASGAGHASRSEVDNAINAFADKVTDGLPEPWSTSLRAAARSNAGQVPRALADAVRDAVSGGAEVPVWWRLITVWQWLLTVLAVGGVVWAVVIAVAHGGREKSTLLGDVSLIPWLLVMAAALLLLGFLTASGCRNMAVVAAERERQHAEEAMRAGIAAAARDTVLAPAGQEIAQYERFRKDLAVAGVSQGAMGGGQGLWGREPPCAKASAPYGG
ncbi:MAG TPA: GTP-binding protein [Candidatus Dormibacteraeota bacterium]